MKMFICGQPKNEKEFKKNIKLCKNFDEQKVKSAYLKAELAEKDAEIYNLKTQLEKQETEILDLCGKINEITKQLDVQTNILNNLKYELDI